MRHIRGSLLLLLLECFAPGDELVVIHFTRLTSAVCLIGYSSPNETALDELPLGVVCIQE